MYIHKSIQLTTAPLGELLLKGQSLDFRLDEARWCDLDVGDCIEFWEDFTGRQTEPCDDSRRVTVRIAHIYRAATFPELFDLIEADSERLEDRSTLLSGLRDWWCGDMESDTGVLAFHVVVEK
ncbi:hypothetical protein N9L26_01045 [Candidatus Pacebacteria bacterium]|nr:hypothetical protein [Candidatus Paceibacterota bacterium]